jgi:hypothetical protein
MEYIIAFSIACILISAITGYMYQAGMNELFENYREIIEMMRKLNDEHNRQ